MSYRVFIEREDYSRTFPCGRDAGEDGRPIPGTSRMKIIHYPGGDIPPNYWAYKILRHLGVRVDPLDVPLLRSAGSGGILPWLLTKEVAIDENRFRVIYANLHGNFSRLDCLLIYQALEGIKSEVHLLA